MGFTRDFKAISGMPHHLVGSLRDFTRILLPLMRFDEDFISIPSFNGIHWGFQGHFQDVSGHFGILRRPVGSLQDLLLLTGFLQGSSGSPPGFSETLPNHSML